MFQMLLTRFNVFLTNSIYITGGSRGRHEGGSAVNPDDYDPWKILARDNAPTDIPGLDIGGLIYVIQRATVALCFLTCAVSVIVLMVNSGDNRMLSEKKKAITHKAFIAMLVSGVITLFAVIKHILDNSFYL